MKKVNLHSLCILFSFIIACDSSIEASPSLFGNYIKFSEVDGWEENTNGEFFVSANTWEGIIKHGRELLSRMG